MLKALFISTFCILTYNLNAYQTASAKTEPKHIDYLLWDNHTLASEEDLLIDPLLILRASERYNNHKDNLKNAYKRIAGMNFSSPAEFSKEIAKNIQPPSPSPSRSKHPIILVEHLDSLSKPHFHVKNTSPCEQLWWQISKSRHFTDVISSFDCICPYTNTITLSDLEKTFLDDDTNYFFRAKAKDNESWGPWSNTIPFSVSKPDPVEDLCFVEGAPPRMIWKQNKNQECTYLVFGSNSIDFIPSIYDAEQPEAIINDEIVAVSNENNFLGETKEAQFSTEQRFAYYRVITKSGNTLSNPSQLLPINDGQMAPECNIICKSPENNNELFRKNLPDGYAWLQKRVSTHNKNSTQYVRNPYVDEDTWNTLSPYFLPEHFPQKAVLDRIFSQRRVISSYKSFYKSGFTCLTAAKDKIIVARHPYLKGFLIKAYTDQMTYPDDYWWKKRIDGTIAIRQSIAQHGFEGIMKVPKKWIYPLPPEPNPLPNAPYRKNFILVVEEMDILDKKHNLKAYQTQMTPYILDSFYTILSELKLIDSIYADNTPFCKDGRLAFVDTEHSLDTTRPVPLTTVGKYLTGKMYSYWEQLIVNGGPH